MVRTSSIPESASSAICIPNGVVSGRARAAIGLSFKGSKPYSRAPNQSVATTPLAGDVIAAWSSLCSVRLRLAIDASRTLKRLASRIFSRQRRDLSGRGTNFSRAFEAAGKPSSLPRVKFCQEPSRSVFHGFQFPPVLSSSVLHADQLSMEEPVACPEKVRIRSVL